MELSYKTFYDKVLGCWMGKNIGGTLGTPVEWKRQINNFTFYTHDLNGEPLPNDDLDLQLIWLKCLEDWGVRITARELGEYWLDYQIANYSEYGIAKSNLRAGFQPPLSGTIGNEFKDSNGSYIRSEIWACICPGRPDLAATYCYEDAAVDHGNGEGTYATVFMGAMESAAFVINDFRKIIDVGLSYIPKDCGVAKAIKTAFECYESGMDWVECRDTLLEKHRGSCFWNDIKECSKRDIEKGFHTGKLGYNAPINIAIMIAGMLYGEGDFEKSMCITVNMGEDADCTCGSYGALYGIMNGFSKIPQKWIDPIGHSIKTICCNEAHGAFCPKTVEELTERVIRQTKAVSIANDGFDLLKTIHITDKDDLSDLDESKLYSQNLFEYEKSRIIRSMNGPRYDHPLFSAALDYKDTYLDPNGEAKLSLLLSPRNYCDPINVKAEFISEDFTVEPQKEVLIPLWSRGIRQVEEAEFVIKPKEFKAFYEGIIRLSIPGRHTRMFLPVSFTGYNRKEYDEVNKVNPILEQEKTEENNRVDSVRL